MSGLVASVRAAVPQEAVDCRIARHGCSLDIADTPLPQVVIDMDHGELDVLRDRPQCDYLFVVEDGTKKWVIPVELKSGGLRNEHTVRQLQTGADFADRLMPAGRSFRLAAVIAHGVPLHRSQRNLLLRLTIRLRNEVCNPLLYECGASLKPLFSEASPAEQATWRESPTGLDR